VDGEIVFTQSGAVTSGAKTFNNAAFVSGYKMRIVRVTTRLSSATGNIASAQLLVNGSAIGGSYPQNGTAATDTLLGSPLVIDGTVSPQRLGLNVSTTGSPTDYIFSAQYQIIT
jgi:hypothetical protein